MKYAIIIFASIFVILLCAHVSGGVNNQTKKTSDPVKRLVFREIPAEIDIKEEKKEFIKTEVFAATDGTSIFILFDRKGYSGRNIVSADCILVLGGEEKSQFQISHCAPNSSSLFIVSEDTASAHVMEQMKKVTIEKDDFLAVRLKRVVSQ